MDVDGFSFNEAAEVPNDFWKTCSKQLRAIKPVFLLAESDLPAHRNNGYFHANYGWEFYYLMNDIELRGSGSPVLDRALQELPLRRGP